MPAAGIFPGWPDRAAKVTIMDPFGGSGHFLVAAFEMLKQMRMEEEDLSEKQAADAILRDNLFGLEIDPRCTQIAAFSLALAAWKSGGYRQLPLPNIACSGIAVTGQLETWTRLAGDDVNLRQTLERHYHLFRNAPDLGSLINPNDVPLRERMFSADYAQVEPLLARALAKERTNDDPVSAVFGAAAEGVARAVHLLAMTYTLVATNVPYLGLKKQSEMLKQFCGLHHPDTKMDLATVFVERCRTFVAPECTYAIVTPQNWLFLGSYKKMRINMLENQSWEILARLGESGFESSAAAGAFTVLLILTNRKSGSDHVMIGMDVSSAKVPSEKALLLRQASLKGIEQEVQLSNPDMRVSLERASQSKLLEQYAISPRGIVNGDTEFWVKRFWELPRLEDNWRYLQGTVRFNKDFSGREDIINWKTGGKGMLRPGIDNLAYNRRGVAINLMRSLSCTLYTGELYEQSVTVIVPHNPAHLPAIWAFCQSPEFHTEVRRIDQKINVTNATLLKVPFDLEHWQRVADTAGPLSEPYSNDPTQWLFGGHIVGSKEPLQVAVARLLGYNWPQKKPDHLNAYLNQDSIICLLPIAGERPASEQLRTLLSVAYEEAWTPALQDRLLAAVGFGGKSLEEWLRDAFFAQHCSLFHNRPFIWHIWDGLKDGFSALVNSHQLDTAGLDRLIYTYLGSWIMAQKVEGDAGVPGAEARHVAAINLQKKLKAIRVGEDPYDIYVHWKPLSEQPLGLNHDLHDGVRINIRPFVTAGILRSRFTINWNKDRGTNPDGSERLNDLHYTLAEKREARPVTIQ